MKKQNYNLNYNQVMQMLQKAELAGRKKANFWTILFFLKSLYESKKYRSKRLKQAIDDFMTWTLYVHDGKIDGEKIIEWAKEQGILEYLNEKNIDYK